MTLLLIHLLKELTFLTFIQNKQNFIIQLQKLNSDSFID